MKVIKLTGGRQTIVNDDDYEKLSSHRWCFNVNGYAVRAIKIGDKWVHQYLHRLLLGLQYGDNRQADHINRDKLDNRRENLRVATFNQNCRNARRKRMSTKPGGEYKGVWRNGKIWCSVFGSMPNRKYLGQFKTPIEAALAWDAEARKQYGQFAKLNFPMEGER